MKKCFSALIASLICSVFYSNQVLSDLGNKCLISVPIYTKSLITSEQDILPVYIQADKVMANNCEYFLFSGNVYIKHGNNTLTADQVQFYKQQKNNNESVRAIRATGNINYFNNKINIQGFKIWSNLNTKDIDVYQCNYQLVGRQGRGDANMLKQRVHNRYTVLENGSFTSCLQDDNSWSIVGSKIIHDHQDQVAKIWKAKFKIGNIPIFYSPYLRIPIGNKRRSGFLIPNINYCSNNGFKFSTPYYMNLTPNYNATITPNISKYGPQIQTELNYLTTPNQGLLEFDWTHNSKIYKNEHNNNNHRWLLNWRHNEVMNKVWHFNVDYTKVSDLNYFNDLDSKYGSSTDSYTTQKFSFSYNTKNWDTALSYRQFQLFDKNYNNAYRAAPQFCLTYYKNNIGPFDFKVFSQVVKFINVNSDYPKATRMHIEPAINLPLINYWGSLNTEYKLMATYYQQNNIDYYNKNITTCCPLDRSVSRILPQFKTSGSMVFERDTDYHQGCIQTLDMNFQYLYIPYRNQNNIGIYDSTILPTDYSNLFRDRIYSGLDRISSLNQLVASVTTRIYDSQHIEQFNASIGQIYYISKPSTGDVIDTWNKHNNTDRIIWMGDSYWRMSNKLGIYGRLQYDFRLNNMALGNAILEYHYSENRILQLNYRYANLQYIKQILSYVINSRDEQEISQIGIISSWPLIERWLLVGAYYYNTKSNQLSEELIGLQYNTCCWAISVDYKRNISGWNHQRCSSKYNNKVSFNIELRGLTSNNNIKTDKIFNSSILSYQRIF